MLRPYEMTVDLPMNVANGLVSTTLKVWDMLEASSKGELETVKKMVDACPELIYAQYNYTPPIHFAVREGHLDLVKYLLDHGAHDASYRIYPFLDNLQTVALDREYDDIALLLEQYANDPGRHIFKGDNGKINFNRTDQEKEFEEAVDQGNIEQTEKLLKAFPAFVHDGSFFWGEGILMMAAKDNNRKLAELLMRYGAKVPVLLKWTQEYYFKHYEMAAFLMDNGMGADTMSWHRVTILHDMAQKGNIPKAELLLERGANINAIDEEYMSTPLGMAARWGHVEMVEYLLKKGADPNRSGAVWATPLIWAQKKNNASAEKLLRDAGAGG